MLASCSDDKPGGSSQLEAGTYQLSGKVEKGPFVRGSSISIQPLDASLNTIGTVYNGEIADDAGNFNLGKIEIASQYVRITSDGYFFNEISGNLSNGTLHLVALADLTDRSSVNVNIITHLKTARIQKLMQRGASFSDANKQAYKELLKQFGLQAYESIPAENMSISAGTDGSGVLIAISSIILSDRTEAQVTQYLSTLSQDLADDGAFTEANMAAIHKSKNHVTAKLEEITQNIKNRYDELGMEITIPDLRYFFDWNNDGIAGNEINDNAQIVLSQNEVHFGKEGGEAFVTVTSDIPLSLKKFNGPYSDDEDLPNIFIPNKFKLLETGNPIDCKYTYENNIIKITVAPTERRSPQSTSIPLYDMLGNIKATVDVTLEGDKSIETKLSDEGKTIVTKCFSQFASALSWMFYVERGYTGMYKFFDVTCPLTPYNQYNQKAYNAAYQHLSLSNNIIKELYRNNDLESASFFQLLDAIVYTEMVDKWGRIAVLNPKYEIGESLPQQEAKTTLKQLEYQLDEISSSFTDCKADQEITSAQSAFNISKDVWRVAKANVYMALGQPEQAMPYLQQIVDSRRYTLTSGNEYTPNDGTILHLLVPDEVMPGHSMGYYTYADVLLTLAECHIATGDNTTAKSLISQVAKAKGISLNQNNIATINSLRKQLFIPRYFAFQKRNKLGEYEAYQHLWPIPGDQIIISNGWTQNPGY
ncbi:MAG: RagB/SusD family nutrient uptake outer membrane protein [Muribaculum sp.]|nr:RagB/SusD family nutrient uptake outer membrane protein [Muribaculaceae bacterium]MCM1081791.1 RagB/SusD family nutrient uptake outer membrane protein [Muribaculum sp.]